MIIAEVGYSWNGHVFRAFDLIWEAQKAGADLVKFQLFNAWNYSWKPFKYEINFSEAEKFFEYGQKIGIEVFFSVFDVERVDWCELIGVKRYKVAFAERHNDELLKAIEKTGKPMIISVPKANDCSPRNHAQYLYCVPEYPTSPEKIDWDEMVKCGGFSDHTMGTECAKKAISNGVRIIEKHFCQEGYKGIDSQLSITANQLRGLVEFDRNRNSD